MTIVVEAINAAKTHLMALYDEYLPDWEDPARRLAFISATEEVFESLDVALYSATTPAAVGCIIPESEDGIAPATSDG